MISALTLENESGSIVVPLLDTANGRGCVSLSGLVGTAAVRSSRRVKPQRRGGLDETAYTDGALMAGEFEAWSTVSPELALSTFRTMVAAMRDTLTERRWLRWTEGTTGLQLQREVKLASETDPILKGNAALLQWQAQFFSEDDRAFSRAQTTYTGTTLSALGGGKTYPFVYPRTYALSGGGTLTVTNAGTDDTSPIWRIYGYAAGAQIVDLADSANRRLVFNESVAAGNFLEVDVATRTVTLNGDANQELPNLVKSSASTWFDLPPGTSNLQLLADSFDGVARLDCLARAAY